MEDPATRWDERVSRMGKGIAGGCENPSKSRGKNGLLVKQYFILKCHKKHADGIHEGRFIERRMGTGSILSQIDLWLAKRDGSDLFAIPSIRPYALIFP